MSKRPLPSVGGVVGGNVDQSKRVKGAEESSFAKELAGEHGAAGGSSNWARPPLPSPLGELSFNWIDMDVTEGAPLPVHPSQKSGGQQLMVPGSRKGPVPILRMYGVTGEGNSVLVHVHGFTPYFWAAPGPDMKEEHLPAWQAALEGQLTGQKLKGRLDAAVLSVQLVPDKQSLLGYHFGRKQHMLKVYVAMPSLVTPAKGVLERGLSVPGIAPRSYMCFEANVPFVLRFMIDRDITGCNWCSVGAGAYLVRGEGKRTCPLQLEVDVVYDSLTSHAPEGAWQRIAPLRILSFDIECMGRKGCFPEADQDPVIQIASVVTVQGASTSIVRNVFTFGTCSPIVGADVIPCATEEEMLKAWARFLREVDPDIITGYNVQNFDLPYLLNRCKKLKLEDAQMLGRLSGIKASMRDTTFQSSAHGKRENVETQVDGRVVFDMLQYMRREHKLSSYSLNSVSAHFLGQQKEDVHHSIIADLQQGTPDDRRRLAVYCLKDSFLPQRLADKLMVVINHVEMARVTGVPLDFLLSRGQQIKVVSMLYRKCKPLGFLVPTLPRAQGAGGEEGETFEGATVIDPKKGYYDEPIATLDFASLYPSIMQAHNLCYSTLLAPEDVKKLPADSSEAAPEESNFFVRSSVAKGVLPMILDELLAARKRAKKDMAAATDPFVVAVQNGRQLALKISANSVYGFTGATVGMLPCLPISSSVTAYGRHMIQDTKRAVEQYFTLARGFPADAVVVYGDTDSVMVKFGVKDVATAMALGAEASREVTKLFPPPVKLEFEKVYFPFLLMNKKRYAGLYWSKPEKWDKMDTKGIETVRRDNCGLVRTVIETVLTKILVERSVAGAVEYVKQVIADLLQNKLDISMLVITKALGKGADAEDYKMKLAHVELAERMRKRDPGSAPAVGDRVPYVLIEGVKGAPMYELSEDPIYVLENNIPINTRYYLDNQLNGPLTRIFEPIIDNVSSLFTGDHTRTIAKPTPTQKTGIMAFAVKTLKCMSCKSPLPAGESCLCNHCKPKEPEVYRRQLALVNEQESRFSQLWTQCQRCQGSLHADVLCTSKDCPIFYMRKKVQKDLKDATEELSRFNIGW